MKVNGLQWTVMFTSNERDLEIDGVVHLGVTDRSQLTVFLDDNLRGDLLRKVLVHELTHVWAFSYGYRLVRDDEEFLCSFIDSYAEDIISHADEFLSERAYGHILHSKRRLL